MFTIFFSITHQIVEQYLLVRLYIVTDQRSVLILPVFLGIQAGMQG